MSKKTVIIGATPNPTRYAHTAGHLLKSLGNEIVPMGIKKGEVAETEILDLRSMPKADEIHTITMYVSGANQMEWEDYILSLNPKRIIFNPGAENPSLERKAMLKGIETLNACTLVMLRTNQY